MKDYPGALARAWRKLRASYWGSLSFDVGLIVVALIAIHAWNTRHLPQNQPMPGLPTVVLDHVLADIPDGQAGVVYFFAPWCGYCRTSMGNLDDLVVGGRVEWARGVALDYSDEGEVREFLAKAGFRQPVLMGTGDTARDWRISAYPTYFVINGEGRIVSRSVGYSTTIGLWARTWLASD